ncbi:hypothetical protein GCM10025868_42340 [Angustibacter aerolatus]|uniref:Uncharacterized protein n=1 Tax=Angustibacter aerolatus TaxID=1162965 RepID=A0ABQ6JPD3_9ACTN|nr:hypothetical protein GCM10025868_42340 [Angustibacter aerolatus]
MATPSHGGVHIACATSGRSQSTASTRAVARRPRLRRMPTSRRPNHGVHRPSATTWAASGTVAGSARSAVCSVQSQNRSVGCEVHGRPGTLDDGHGVPVGPTRAGRGTTSGPACQRWLPGGVPSGCGPGRPLGVRWSRSRSAAQSDCHDRRGRPGVKSGSAVGVGSTWRVSVGTARR